jgi:hypothetical protein
MKATEVRVGNWATNSNGDIFQIDTGAFFLLHQNKEWDIKPIILTEEWLLKLGFDINIPYGWFYRGFKLNKNFSYELIGDAIKIKYVHQLQNLYFALTGEELTIK